ncbi:MAG: acyloxyacyl hydrolase [Phycisphaerales bacterium]|nr:acyloxyacyl hydrolase [Phycisphaerales bacterium]
MGDQQRGVSWWWVILLPAVVTSTAEAIDPLQLVTAAQESPAQLAEPTIAKPKFGAEGSWRWQILGAYMSDLEGDSQYEFGGGVSWFVVENLSVDLEVEGDFIAQSGGDVWGGAATLLFRWHFIAERTWSLYGDLGSGLIATTAPTPATGTSFNFTPQAGGGVSFDISPDARLMVGARWYHISNANLGETNPGRNSVMAYVMVSFPF